MRAIAAAAIASVVLGQPSPEPSPAAKCQLASNGATYDFSALAAESGFTIYNSRVTDDNGGTSGVGSEWGYAFAVCNNMRVPLSCNMTGSAPAYQICVKPEACGNACYKLGDDAKNGVLAAFPWNPAHGARMQYTGGDTCQISGQPPSNRSMALDFICYDTPGLVQSQDMVIEDITCGYHALLYSRAGCPLECPLSSPPGAPNPARRLCAGQGLCDYDTDKAVARCFCDAGWGGRDCTLIGGAAPPPVSWVHLGGTIVGGIALGVALVLGGVFVRSYFAGGSFFDYLNFFGGSGGCSLPGLPSWGGRAAGGPATDYKAAPSGEEPLGGYKAPVDAPPPAFAASNIGSAAPAYTTPAYAPPSGSLNDGPLL